MSGTFCSIKNIDLTTELPPDHFAIYIPREVEIETNKFHTPNRPSGSMLQEQSRLAKSRRPSVFGFGHEGPGPQTHGGLDVGVWQSETEADFMQQFENASW